MASKAHLRGITIWSNGSRQHPLRLVHRSSRNREGKESDGEKAHGKRTAVTQTKPGRLLGLTPNISLEVPQSSRFPNGQLQPHLRLSRSFSVMGNVHTSAFSSAFEVLASCTCILHAFAAYNPGEAGGFPLAPRWRHQNGVRSLSVAFRCTFALSVPCQPSLG